MIEKVCPTCGAIGCEEHKRKPWANSTRRSKTRSGWSQQRRARHVLLIHSGKCGVCGLHGATQVDHIVPLSEGGSDDLDNLQPIHAIPCHRDKTAREAQRARSRKLHG